MTKFLSSGFWPSVASTILRYKLFVLLFVIGFTVFLGTQWQHIRFSHSGANLLPDNHEVNLKYNTFLEKFGDEGTLIVIGVKNERLFTPDILNKWNALSTTISNYPAVSTTISLQDLRVLDKQENPARFDLNPFITDSVITAKQANDYREKLFNDLPFYENLIYNKETGTIRSAIYLEKSILNTPARKKFIINDLIPIIKQFEEETQLNVHTSGMSYVGTLNSQNILDEMQWFVVGSLLVTSIIFFLFFKSIRATIIAMTTVLIGVMWALGILGLLEFEITVLTALIPPLIIVIGIPNCIFLINKYQQEYKNHKNKTKALHRVISKIGNVTLMTNVTTAAGFATFAFTESSLLKEFGIVASLNILGIFLLSLLIIPIMYSYMPAPKEKHLKHLDKKWIEGFVDWMERMVKQRRVNIYIISLAFLIASIIGMYQIRVSGSIIEDVPKNADFYKDIKFFEEEFDGIMPLEILIDTKKEKGVMKMATLKRMEELSQLIEKQEELSKPISVVNLVKYAKQAYYNGNPKYYELPSSNERNFILPYASSFSESTNLMGAYVDSTGQYARITTFMKDIGTDKMEHAEDKLRTKIKTLFPEERYEVNLTGKALVFQKGTDYLVSNLITSLTLAIFLIALFMAWMFRSFRMILISLIPNILPLLVTAGLMGYLGVPIKPSTILVFSIAFGISVDDTIHFLAKYRQELQVNNWDIKKSVYASLRETGVSMFYTSIVLFFGFSIFMLSNFGGTVALGGLVSITLLLAMLSNLLLLPSLLLSSERPIANKKALKTLSSESDKKENTLE